MKINSLLLALGFYVVPVAMAAPNGGKTYRVDKLDEAAASAKSEQLLLLLVSSASPEDFAKSPGPISEPDVSRIAEDYEEPGVEVWTNSEGKEVRGTFISGNDNILTLKLENGKEAKVPFDKLSEESRVRARVLAIRKALRPKK